MKLNLIQAGSIALSKIDAIAIAKNNKLTIGILGMDFLNRMTVKKEGSTITLIKRCWLNVFTPLIQDKIIDPIIKQEFFKYTSSNNYLIHEYL